MVCCAIGPPPWERRAMARAIGMAGWGECCSALLSPPGVPDEQISGPIFRQNSFPLPWIAVPGPKHTFPLDVVQLESCGNSKCLSSIEK